MKQPSKRDPSLHITYSNFKKVLIDVYKEHSVVPDIDELVDVIFDKCKGYSISNRNILVSNNKLKRAADKIKMAPRNNTALFAQTMVMERRRLKHRGLITPKVGDDEWLKYKEATKLATEFCNEFNLSLKEGYLKYIQLGMPKMKKFSIYKFKNLHNSILEEYEAIHKIEQDPFPSQTKKAHQVYMDLILDKVGFAQSYEDRPAKYAAFVEAMAIARQYGASPGIYIQAQFHGLDWQNSIPDPLQLLGTKAIERLQRYCFENQIKLKDSQAVKKVNFSKIFSKD